MKLCASCHVQLVRSHSSLAAVARSSAAALQRGDRSAFLSFQIITTPLKELRTERCRSAPPVRPLLTQR